MRWTQTLIPSLRNVPKDAEAISHQLALRAGLIRQLSSGVYSYLPLGFRTLLKIIGIIREEMNRAGASRGGCGRGSKRSRRKVTYGGNFLPFSLAWCQGVC